MRRYLLGSLVSVSLLSVTRGRADEGEVSLAVSLVPEVAWLSHPLTKKQVPFDATSALVFLPRAGLGLRYGLTDTWTVGVGLDGSFGYDVVSKGLVFGGTPGELATGTRLDLMVPLSASWRLDTGTDVSATVEVAAGPCGVAWLANKALNPTVLGTGGLPTELPVTIADSWNVGAFTRVSLLFDARPLNWLVLDVGVSATASWAGTGALELGLVVRPSFVLPEPP
jgi:hypothetical protein